MAKRTRIIKRGSRTVRSSDKEEALRIARERGYQNPQARPCIDPSYHLIWFEEVIEEDVDTRTFLEIEYSDGSTMRWSYAGLDDLQLEEAGRILGKPDAET